MTYVKRCAQAYLKGTAETVITVEEMLSFVEKCDDFLVLVSLQEYNPWSFEDETEENAVCTAIQKRIEAITIEQLPTFDTNMMQLLIRHECCDPYSLASKLVGEAIQTLLDSITTENCPAWVMFMLMIIKIDKDYLPEAIQSHWNNLAERLASE